MTTTTRPSRTLHVAHCSMQFSDTPRQQEQDAHRLFDRAVDRKWAWLTGTEADPGKSNNLSAILQKVAREHDYRYTRPGPSDSWIAVPKWMIDSDWDPSYAGTVVPGQAGKWSNKGVAAAAWMNNELGHITVLACHYLTKGDPGAADPARRVHVQENRRLADAIGAAARKAGRGRALAFYAGDQNIVDRNADTFFGEPLTSVWDELGKWENTGHGNIDVIASYDRDGRVSAKYARALDDREFPLHTDHFLVEAGFDVRLLAPR